MDSGIDALSDEDLSALLAPGVSTPPSIPTLRQELDRKLSDTLDWMIGRHKSALISNEALDLASDALFMTVSGLAADDLVEVITAIGSYLPSKKLLPLSKFFSRDSDSHMLVVSWTPGETSVIFRKGDGSKSIRPCLCANDARVMFEDADRALLKAGYKEI